MIKIRIFSIDVKIHYSFVVLFVFMINASLPVWEFLVKPGDYIKMYEISFWFSLGFVLAILLHELGHVIANRLMGLKTDIIVFFILGGGACPNRDFESAKEEFISAAAGLITTLLVAIVWYLMCWYFTGKHGHFTDSTKTMFFAFQGYVNLNLLLVNFFPAFPNDGGRMFRSILWYLMEDKKDATMISGTISAILSISASVIALLIMPKWGVLVCFAAALLCYGARVENVAVDQEKMAEDIFLEHKKKILQKIPPKLKRWLMIELF